MFHGGPTPDVARHLAVVGCHKRLLFDQLQCREDISYVVQPPHLRCRERERFENRNQYRTVAKDRAKK